MQQDTAFTRPCEDDAISVFSLSAVDSGIDFERGGRLQNFQKKYRPTHSVSSCSTLQATALKHIPEAYLDTEFKEIDEDLDLK